MSGGWRQRLRPALARLHAYHVPPLPCAVKLDANESPFAPSAELSAALGEAVRGAHLERYPDPQATRLRAAVAAHLGQPPGRLCFGNGSDELIGLLCQAFAAAQQDGAPGRVLFPGPTFVFYRTAAIAAGLEVVEAPLGARFAADEGALEEAIARTRPNLVFVATPNNPTGTRWPRAALERLVARHPDTAIVIDEAYASYGGESHLDLVAQSEHCLSLRTYSKVGLAGLRLGVVVAQEAVIAELEKLRGPYNLGLLPQLAGELCIGRFGGELSAHVATIVGERERVFAALQQVADLEVFPSAANLLLVRVADAGALWRGLLDRGVLVRNLDRPGPLSGCLRVTVGTPAENDHFLSALSAALPSSPPRP